VASDKPVTAADKRADTNNDGVLSQAEKRAAARKKAQAAKTPAKKTTPKQTGSATGLTQDRLTKRELRSEYKITARQLAVHKDLFDLFQKAFDGQWDKARFDSELEQTDWYRTNAAPMREFLLLRAEGGADWNAKVLDTREAVRRKAMEMGVNLSAEDINDLAEESMMFGWGERGQEYELQRAIVERPSKAGEYGGDIQANVDNLKALALANNVKLDDSWFMSKAKSIASGLGLADDAEREVREFAAQKAPGFADQILAGENLDALVTPWRRMMQDEWELAEDAIDLNDPMLQKAINGFDEAGKPVKANLGDFQIALRKDPRWLQTNAGQNKTTSAFSDVLKMFGMGN